MDPASTHWQPGGTYQLCASEAHHVRVMRFEAGESIQVVDGCGRAAIVTLTRVDPAGVSVLVYEVHQAAPEVRIGLIQALSKNDRDLQAVETCVEIGAASFIPWQADRSIVRWRGERAQKAHQKWVDTAVRATKQSRRADQPAVGPMVTSKQLVDAVAQASERGVLVAVCHEEATQYLVDVLATRASSLSHPPSTSTPPPEWDVDVMLAVGPEGGISPAEVEALTHAGAVLVSLGSNILRASTAGAVGAVLTRHILGDKT